MFGVDLGAVHPEDPGYNLRPEHIESTWYLAALTGVWGRVTPAVSKVGAATDILQAGRPAGEDGCHD